MEIDITNRQAGDPREEAMGARVSGNTSTAKLHGDRLARSEGKTNVSLHELS